MLRIVSPLLVRRDNCGCRSIALAIPGRKLLGAVLEVAIAVAMVGPALAAFAMASAAQRLGLQLHQVLCGEADHLAQ
jgi:uncharacterized membrane protein